MVDRMQQLNVGLTEELVDKISEEMDSDHTSAASVVRKALRKYFKLD